MSDATWLDHPSTGNFNAGANWNTGTRPDGIAFFDFSDTTALSFSAHTAIDGWTFNPGASDYTFINAQNIDFFGAGIVIDGGSATITNQTHRIKFWNMSTAGSATIINNGTLVFADQSTAGQAQIINNAGGIVDFSESAGPLAGPELSAGSIAGAGDYILGSNQLTVGGNNLSTEVSGVISGVNGGLDKIGAGTLTLSGSNQYTSVTRVFDGTLEVNGSIANSVQTIVFSGATLNGNGTTGAVFVVSGGTLAPGTSAGLLTTGNLEFELGAAFAIELGGTTAGTGGYDQARVIGAVNLGGAALDASLINGFNPAGGSFTIIDNNGTDAVTGTFAGLAEGATVTLGGRLFVISYMGGTGNDVVLSVLLNQVPVNTVPGTQEVEGNHSLAIVGLSAADPDAGSGTLTTTLSVAHGMLTVASASNAAVVGSGTSTVTLSGTLAQINATLAAAGNVTYAPARDFFGTDALIVTTNDNGHSGVGGAMSDTDTVVIHVNTLVTGTSRDDSLTALPGNMAIVAGSGDDAVAFGCRLIDATVTYQGNQIVIDSVINGAASHAVLSGVERFVFTDGTVENSDGDRLVDDLFYYSQNHDVWNAHVEADAHYHTSGWHEGRDPNAFFSTATYLLLNPAVKAAGLDPLVEFDQHGWMEGRVPSFDFDPAKYLAANPDVAAAHIDPLAHFLAHGAAEGRSPFAVDHVLAPNGFDYVYYLQNNPDVAAAGVDPLWHFNVVGWQEGRDPNALFDTSGYLATYGDVAAAGVNPFEHYHVFGWKEGRDPSVDFDTTSYLAAYPDVAAAGISPFTHFLQHGLLEGRSAFADGAWG